MIEFKESDNKIILCYTDQDDSWAWVNKELQSVGKVSFWGKALRFLKSDLINELNEDLNSDELEESDAEFIFAEKKDDYYRILGRIVGMDNDLYIHKDIPLKRNLFVTVRDALIFPRMGKMIRQHIYIGGNNQSAITYETFIKIIRAFPNKGELDKYVDARISSILSKYIDIGDEFEKSYENYLNKKISKKNAEIAPLFFEVDINKYELILQRLEHMLESDMGTYNETAWQNQILEILLLLYPKYLYVCREAPVKDEYQKKERKLDYLLIDAFGNTDVVEIKRPSEKSIVTKGLYRDNHVPLRELSGSIMQIEKYIFHLNKSGKAGEARLTAYCLKHNIIPANFSVKVTNPSGIVIMGRTEGLTVEQVQDFEVVKRKYKNIIDIITYDDLIQRLKRTIRHWKNVGNI